KRPPVGGGDAGLLLRVGMCGDQFRLPPLLQHACFGNEEDRWVQRVSGGPPRQLTWNEEIGKPGPLLFSQWPEWSPDSTRIAYLSKMERGIKVVVASLAEGEVIRIAPDEDVYGLGAFTWSADGRRLAIS